MEKLVGMKEICEALGLSPMSARPVVYELVASYGLKPVVGEIGRGKKARYWPSQVEAALRRRQSEVEL